MSEITLANELKYYDQHKSEYLKVYKNTFVVIRGSKLLGNFTTQQEAYAAGIAAYGNEPFLIKYVTDQDAPAIQAPALQLL